MLPTILTAVILAAIIDPLDSLYLSPVSVSILSLHPNSPSANDKEVSHSFY
jgi:hypothetical protein